MIERPLEPPEPKEKQFLVETNCSCKGYYYVWAKNKEEAKEMIQNREYDERFFSNYEIEEITDCEEYYD